MNVLIAGADGFIGFRLAEFLQRGGHCVRCCVRNPHRIESQIFETAVVDFNRATTASDWLPALEGIQVVINAVGIFSERGGATFGVIHDEAPRALFSACAIANVTCVIQFSALGAKLDADTEFLRSKARADEFLQQQRLRSLVLQPSLVFGIGGKSSELFVMLAALPLIVLPDGGVQRIQPVHIDDICTAVLRFIEKAPRFARDKIAAVGAQEQSLRSYIESLRASLGKPRHRIIAIASDRLAVLGKWLPMPWLRPEALRMLQSGNCADAGAFAALLERQPRSTAQFGSDAYEIYVEQTKKISVEILRCSLALLWIATGLISMGIYPIEESALLLERVGIPADFRIPLLYMAALLDIALGIAILASRRAWVWMAQGLVIVFYSAVIAWKLPEFWLHPFAPLLKNIPLLAAIYLLYRWNGSTAGQKHRVRAR